MFSNIGGSEVIIIALFAFLLFGPKKIPGIAKNIGKAINTLNKSLKEVENEIKDDINSNNTKNH
jgi:sec-independent protein translocase protein TatA